MGLLLAQDVLLGASEDHLQDPPRDDICQQKKSVQLHLLTGFESILPDSLNVN